MFFPYYWMFVSSVETDSIFTWTPNLIPSGFSLDSYWTIFEERDIGRWLFNTPGTGPRLLGRLPHRWRAERTPADSFNAGIR